jgi:hypothetical protein
MADVTLAVRRTDVGLGNIDHYGQRSLGQVEFRSPLLRFLAFVHEDGNVTLPACIVDKQLRRALTETAREAVLDELHRKWQAITDREAAKQAAP